MLELSFTITTNYRKRPLERFLNCMNHHLFIKCDEPNINFDIDQPLDGCTRSSAIYLVVILLLLEKNSLSYFKIYISLIT